MHTKYALCLQLVQTSLSCYTVYVEDLGIFGFISDFQFAVLLFIIIAIVSKR